jgi:hypothetical protein
MAIQLASRGSTVSNDPLIKRRRRYPRNAGSQGYTTFFRNRVIGQHQDPALINDQYGNQGAIQLNAGMVYNNVIGNVVGLSGLKSTAGYYVGAPACFENVNEKDAVNRGPPCITSGGYDGTQTIALFRLGNASIAGAFSSFDVNETNFPNVPKVNASTLRHGNFDYTTNAVAWNPALANHDLPPSLYLVDKPAFFGSATWP